MWHFEGVGLIVAVDAPSRGVRSIQCAGRDSFVIFYPVCRIRKLIHTVRILKFVIMAVVAPAIWGVTRIHENGCPGACYRDHEVLVFSIINIIKHIPLVDCRAIHRLVNHFFACVLLVLDYREPVAARGGRSVITKCVVTQSTICIRSLAFPAQRLAIIANVPIPHREVRPNRLLMVVVPA
ncbi:MAG: hypothetical protein C5S49_04465 [Candidatus Methanogaster sp.]|nr:MAG: hypothetical protein C5S49_04465 [ANME-2 cluster archaeon]